MRFFTHYSHFHMRTECVFVKIVFSKQAPKDGCKQYGSIREQALTQQMSQIKSCIHYLMNCATQTESCTCLECYTSFSLANLTRSRSNVANPLEPHLRLICEA